MSDLDDIPGTDFDPTDPLSDFRPTPTKMAAVPVGQQPGVTTATTEDTPVVTTSTTQAAVTPTVPSSSSTANNIPTTSSTLAIVTPSTSTTSSSALTSSGLPSSSTTSSAITSSTTSSSSSSSALPSSSTTSTASSSSSSSASPTVVTTTNIVTQSRPGLVTSFSSVTRSSTAVVSSAAAGQGKGGVGGSGLALGALVGIIIGAVVFLCIVAMLVTRSVRKRARAKRTAHRSSMMFDPAPPPVQLEEEDELEKARYDAPSQSYPMTNATEYNYDYPPHSQGYPVATSGAAGLGAGLAAASAYPPTVGAPYAPNEYYANGTQPEQYDGYVDHVAAEGSSAAALAAGLRDGMMVRVKVGFVRTLEDELAIVPNQQLYLHTAYDDGWSLCEDQAQNRGVVPISCLEPWVEDNLHLQPQGQAQAQGQEGIPRSNTSGSLSAGEAGQRRSSLYVNAQAAGAYLNQGQ